jgi:hypothetical protein
MLIKSSYYLKSHNGKITGTGLINKFVFLTNWHRNSRGNSDLNICMNTKEAMHGCICHPCLFPVAFGSIRNHGSLEKWQIIQLRLAIPKMSLDHHEAPKSKEVIKKQKPYMDGVCQRNQEPHKRALMVKARAI